MNPGFWRQFRSEVLGCEKCPRLRNYCKKIAREKRRAYIDWEYWGKPVPGFGDPHAKLFILGLAPAAHGANRTGRIFTGDQSGFWLYRALHRFGFSNQFSWESREDGLELRGAYVSCVARCAPPQNKPTPLEIKRCLPYLEQELKALKEVQVYVVLGQLAFDQLWPYLTQGLSAAQCKKPKFKHGLEVQLGSGKTLLLSYHPSQQNTFTRKLTEPMFDQVFTRAKEKIEVSSSHE